MWFQRWSTNPFGPTWPFQWPCTCTEELQYTICSEVRCANVKAKNQSWLHRTDLRQNRSSSRPVNLPVRQALPMYWCLMYSTGQDRALPGIRRRFSFLPLLMCFREGWEFLQVPYVAPSACNGRNLYEEGNGWSVAIRWGFTGRLFELRRIKHDTFEALPEGRSSEECFHLSQM